MPAKGGRYAGFKGVIHAGECSGKLNSTDAYHYPKTLAATTEDMPSSEHLIWIDLEMTGLKRDSDLIIVIATVVTDKELAVVAEGPVLGIHQSEDVLAGMDDWNQKQHGSSGLLARVRASKISTADAEARTLEFLAPLVAPGASPICGNKHFARIAAYLARVQACRSWRRFFHYRNPRRQHAQGVGAGMALGTGDLVEGFTKQGTHLAHADIMESIRELQHYRAKLFAPQFSGRR